MHAENEIGWRAVRDLKVEWAKIVVYWDLTEAVEGKFNWHWSDLAFERIEQNKNVHILLSVNDTPKWLKDRKQLIPFYKRYLSLFLDRYKTKLSDIDAIEIFNEPNNLGYGWLSNERDKNKLTVPLKENAELFANTLRASNELIRPYAPNVILISGGLMSHDNAGLFMQEMFSHDISDCIDVLGYHPYEYHNRLVEVQNIIQNFLKQNKAGEMPIWYTEYGVTENWKRAEYVSEIFSVRNNVNAMFLFTDQDFGVFDNTYGLIDYFGTPKKEYNLFKSYIQKAHLQQ